MPPEEGVYNASKSDRGRTRDKAAEENGADAKLPPQDAQDEEGQHQKAQLRPEKHSSCSQQSEGALLLLLKPKAKSMRNCEKNNERD